MKIKIVRKVKQIVYFFLFLTASIFAWASWSCFLLLKKVGFGTENQEGLGLETDKIDANLLLSLLLSLLLGLLSPS